MKKIVLLLLIVIVATTPFFSTPSFANPSIAAETAVIMEANTGQIIYNKSGDQQMYPASTTKILTALVALKNGKLDDLVTISRKSEWMEGSRVYLLEGEQLPLEQLLFGLMVNSGNDAAIAIAEHISGTEEEFAVLMNKTAKELGAVNSNFVNPHGLFHPEHYTTASDLALITSHALQNEKFREMYNSKFYPWTSQGWEPGNIINNHRIINGQFPYDGITGGKTGYVPESGHNLVTSAKKDNMELIAVVMRSTKASQYQDTINLFNYGFDNFELKKIIEKDNFIDNIVVKDDSISIPAIADKSLYYVIEKNQDLNFTREIEVSLSPDVKQVLKGDNLGTATFKAGDLAIGSVEMVSLEDVQIPTTLKDIKLGLPSLSLFSLPWWSYLIALYVIWRINVQIKRNKRNKRRGTNLRLFSKKGYRRRY